MAASDFTGYMPTVGGAKHTPRGLTDHCRPRGGKTTYPEHDYPFGQAHCRRCGADEEDAP
jgi:hypothetical protein